jgi:hypothetical protein
MAEIGNFKKEGKEYGKKETVEMIVIVIKKLFQRVVQAIVLVFQEVHIGEQKNVIVLFQIQTL